MPKGTRIALALLVLLVIGTGIYWLAAAPGTGKQTPVTPATPTTSGATKPSGATGPSGPSNKPEPPRIVTPGSGSSRDNTGKPAVAPSGPSGAAPTTPPGAGGNDGSGALAGRPTTPPAGASPGDPTRPPAGFSTVPNVGPAPSLDRPIPGFIAAVPPRSTPFDRPGDDSSRGATVPDAPPGGASGSTPGARTNPVPPAPPAAAPNAPRNDAKPAPPTGPSAPASDASVRVTDYVVKDGDTMLSIAEYWFGDRNKWDLIRAANAEVEPTRLKIGQTLRLPAKDAQRQPAKPAATVAEGVHVVQSGESLYAIARAAYGDGELWNTIYDANKQAIGADPTALKVGMKLRIPAKK